METEKLDQNYIAHTYDRYPAVLVKGHGVKAADDKGRVYTDLTSGIGVNIFGESFDETSPLRYILKECSPLRASTHFGLRIK